MFKIKTTSKVSAIHHNVKFIGDGINYVIKFCRKSKDDINLYKVFNEAEINVVDGRGTWEERDITDLLTREVWKRI
jgi:hypothetical protein